MQVNEQEEILKIGKLVLYKNTLIYGRTIVQISNICSVWVADQSYVVHHKTPFWIKALGSMGGLAMLIGLGAESWPSLVVGAMLLAGAVYGYRKHKPSTSVSKYALGVERSSGRVKLFAASDEQFVLHAAQALLEGRSQAPSATPIY